VAPVKKVTEVESLDLAARAEAVEPLLSRAVFPLMFLTLISLVFAFQSEDSPSGTLILLALGLIAAITVIMLWRRWCYALYGLSILNFLGAIHILTSSNDIFSRTFLGSMKNQLLLVWFLAAAYSWGKTAAPFIAAQSDELETERSRVGQWLAELRGDGRDNRVLEFSVKNFWKGSWTYRLLKLENCWAVAKFKSNDMRSLSDYRVHEPYAVKASEQANGKLRIEIADQGINEIETTPEVRGRLLSAASVDARVAGRVQRQNEL